MCVSVCVCLYVSMCFGGRAQTLKTAAVAVVVAIAVVAIAACVSLPFIVVAAAATAAAAFGHLLRAAFAG